ncbi:MAG: hypothetical protein AAF618_04050 [Pseudomonadota bacterium]
MSAFAFVPYTMAIFRGSTRPQRSTWLIWSVLSLTAFIAVATSGGGIGLLFMGAQMGGTVLVLILSFWRGSGSFFNLADALVLAASSVGIAMALSTESAVYALALTIAIGTLAGALTVAKAFTAPQSECMLPWALHALASVFGVASVIGAGAFEMAYPLYLFALYAAILSANGLGYIWARTRKAHLV